jgi:two-component system response regulator DevR
MPATKIDPIRVYLVDDHAMVLVGLKHLLGDSDAFSIVGTAGNVQDALEGIAKTQPDVALVDLRLPDGSGGDVCKQAKALSPRTRFVILTSFCNDAAIFDAIAAGVDGYLLKEDDTDSLLEAIRDIANGHSVLAPSVTKRVLGNIQRGNADAPLRRLQSLSRQEHRIIECISQGMTNKEAANELHLSEKTVKNYLANAMQKLQVGRRTEAVAFFMRYREVANDSSETTKTGTSKRGFSLTEFMVGIALAGIILAGAISSVTLGFRTTTHARDSRNATQILRHEVDSIRLLSWQEVEELQPAHSYPAPEHFTAATGNRFTIIRQLTDDDHGGKRVELRVQWPGVFGGERERAIWTHVSRNGLNNALEHGQLR